MSEQNGKHLEPIELVSMPAGHPARVAKERELENVDAPRRHMWENEFALTDRLRATLPGVPVPDSLERRLLAIPESPDTAPAAHDAQHPAPSRRLNITSFLNWRYAAAFL